MSESTLDLEAIREREKAATKGPWWTEGTSKGIYAHRPGGRPNGEGLFSVERYYGHDNPNAVADAEFVANSRQDIPALLDENKRLRAELATRDGHDRDEEARQAHALNAINGNVRAQYDALAAAVTDLCWRATPFGVDAEGFVDKYLLTTGTVHRLIGAAQCAGISAAFRSPQKIRDDEEARDGHDREQRAAAWDEGYAACATYLSDYDEWDAEYDDSLVEDDYLNGPVDYNPPAPKRPPNPYSADRIEASHDE